MEKQSGASNFTREAMPGFWGVASAQVMPGEGTAADGTVVCTPQSCRLQGEAEALLLRKGNDCSAALLVSAEPIRGDCPPDLPRIDRFSVWHDGAFAAWLDAWGVRLLSDRDYRGERPWVPRDPAHGRLPAGLMPVQTEVLPDE
jgi:competence protein ComEC